MGCVAGRGVVAAFCENSFLFVEIVAARTTSDWRCTWVAFIGDAWLTA
jgi:hypothetical protein